MDIDAVAGLDDEQSRGAIGGYDVVVKACTFCGAVSLDACEVVDETCSDAVVDVHV